MGEGPSWFESAFRDAAIGMAVVSLEGRWLEVNDALCGLLGYARPRLLELAPEALTHPDDLALERSLLQQLVEGRSASYQLEKRYLHATGRELYTQLTVSIVRDGEGATAFLLSQIQDLTARRAAEQSLLLAQRALAVVSDGVLITDPTQPDNPIVYCNASFERITGYREAELRGQSCRMLQGDDRDQPDLALLRDAIREGRPCQVVLRNYRKDGELFLNSLHVTPVRTAEGKLTHFVGSVEDITERVHMEDQIRRAALTDELTGLYNRRGFMLLAEQQLRLAARHRQTVGLLCVDVDGMKRINEELGHDSGDDALIDVATILHRVLRSSDVVARLGGDQFVALVEGDADDVDVLRARLLETLSRHNQVAHRAYHLALTVGSAISVPERPASLNELIARADEAMYTFKRRRRAAHAN